MTFSPDGTMLATTGTGIDTPIEIWNVGFLVNVLARLCSQVGGSITRSDWGHHVGPVPVYRNVCR